MSSAWAWIGRRRERGIIAMCIEHLSRIIKVAELFEEMVSKYIEKSFDEVRNLYTSIFNTEREADDVKRKIIAELSKGMFHPIDREELIRLVLTSDDIAAYLKAAARQLLLILTADLPRQLLDQCLVMSQRVTQACKLIKDAIVNLVDNPKKSLELADKVERIEEEVDEIRLKALEIVLNICKEVEVPICIVTKDFVHEVEEASDKCEDVADVIRSIALLTL